MISPTWQFVQGGDWKPLKHRTFGRPITKGDAI